MRRNPREQVSRVSRLAFSGSLVLVAPMEPTELMAQDLPMLHALIIAATALLHGLVYNRSAHKILIPHEIRLHRLSKSTYRCRSITLARAFVGSGVCCSRAPGRCFLACLLEFTLKIVGSPIFKRGRTKLQKLYLALSG